MLKRKNSYFAAILALYLIVLVFGAAPVQAAPASSPVGIVDFVYLIDHHPETAKANETLRAEQEAAKKEFAEKSVGLGDKEKQDLDRQLGQRVEQKRLDLLKAIADKVLAAVKEVQDAKGLSIVISKREVISGGVDITEDVLKKITGK